MSRFADRVKETTTTTGTGSITLAGAATGAYRSLSEAVSDGHLADGDMVCFCEEDGTDFEVWDGVFTLSGTTLSKLILHSSSNGGAAVNWGPGTKSVFITVPASAVLGAGNASQLPYIQPFC